MLPIDLVLCDRIAEGNALHSDSACEVTIHVPFDLHHEYLDRSFEGGF